MNTSWLPYSRTFEKLKQDEDKKLLKRVQDSLLVIQKAFQEYSLNDLCISFNGGKDSVVVLHLIWLYIEQYNETSSQKLSLADISGYDFRFPPSFQQLYDFADETAKQYRLQMTVFDKSIKDGLQDVVQNHKKKAIFLGVRSTDPYMEKVTHFQPCDSGWPSIMRISPVLEWSYSEIWKFIRILQVPFCCLYAQGFTSIGGIDTVKNPALRVASEGSNQEEYRPAWFLEDHTLERSARTTRHATHLDDQDL